MSIRWPCFDYVPPELKLSRMEHRDICRRARHLRPKGMWRRVNRRAYLIFLAIYGPATVALMLFMAHGVINRRPINPGWLGGIVIIGWIATFYSRGKTHAPFVYQALREKGYDVCAACGYVLRGLSDEMDRCPECGQIREKKQA